MKIVIEIQFVANVIVSSKTPNLLEWVEINQSMITFSVKQR